MNKKILIVGGVAGGASAAARMRRLDEQAEIILLERDEYISFAKKNNVELTVVGSEELLVQGIVDEFHKNGLKINLTQAERS